MTVNPNVSAYVKGYQTVTAQDVEILAKAQLALKGVAEGMSISTGFSMGSNTTTINVSGIACPNLFLASPNLFLYFFLCSIS